MEYSFEYVKSGARVGIEMSMHDAVPVGDTMIYMGEKVRRCADMGRRPQVAKSVAHISRVLPSHILEDGTRATKGADGYTAEGFPIIESQATIDRIERLNPTFTHGKDVLDECEGNAEG